MTYTVRTMESVYAAIAVLTQSIPDGLGIERRIERQSGMLLCHVCGATEAHQALVNEVLELTGKLP